MLDNITSFILCLAQDEAKAAEGMTILKLSMAKAYFELKLHNKKEKGENDVAN